MKLYAPKYYREFNCIADKCQHSCCIGWEIDVDERTLNKYKKLNSGYGVDILNSIEKGQPSYFKLLNDDRCPHLDEKGLCRIISEYGEDFLCDICREHPRFYNDTISGKEVGIGMACEEACRIILSSDDYDKIEEIGEENLKDERLNFNSLVERVKIYEILKDRNLKYEEKLCKISSIYGVSLSMISDDEWCEVIEDLEFLNIENRKKFLNFKLEISTPKEYEKYLERAFAYYIYRHCSSAMNIDDFLSSLGLCVFLERLSASLLKNNKPCNTYDVIQLFRIVSEEIEYSEDNTELIKFQF